MFLAPERRRSCRGLTQTFLKPCWSVLQVFQPLLWGSLQKPPSKLSWGLLIHETIQLYPIDVIRNGRVKAYFACTVSIPTVSKPMRETQRTGGISMRGDNENPGTGRLRRS